MKKINEDEIKTYAKKIVGIDEYYKKFKELESDVQFFTLYMKREAKSEFSFDVKISYKNCNNVFDSLWKRYGCNFNYLELVYAEFLVLRKMMHDIETQVYGSGDENRYTNEQLHNLINYFEMYDEFHVDSAVTQFIGCSLCCTEALRILEKLRNNYTLLYRSSPYIRKIEK